MVRSQTRVIRVGSNVTSGGFSPVLLLLRPLTACNQCNECGGSEPYRFKSIPAGSILVVHLSSQVRGISHFQAYNMDGLHGLRLLRTLMTAVLLQGLPTSIGNTQGMCPLLVLPQ